MLFHAALLLTAACRTLSGAVLSRYALLAGVAIFLLAGLGLDRLRVSWLRWLVAALLIVEVLPLDNELRVSSSVRV
jgi:hypothetical protein